MDKYRIDSHELMYHPERVQAVLDAGDDWGQHEELQAVMFVGDGEPPLNPDISDVVGDANAALTTSGSPTAVVRSQTDVLAEEQK